MTLAKLHEIVPCFDETVPCFNETVLCFDETVHCVEKTIPCLDETVSSTMNDNFFTKMMQTASLQRQERPKKGVDQELELKSQKTRKMCLKQHHVVSRRELVDKVPLCCAS